MRALVKNNKYFFIPYFVFLVVGAATILLTTKSALHLFFNSYHASFFNYFFYYITYLGDGFTATIVTILLLMIRYRYAIIVALSCLLASAITQVLKHYVFYDSLRPKKFFEGIADLHLLSHVENYSYNSFPSGHTTVAFALCTSITFFVQNNTFKLMLFILAFLIGYSRVYISQHFFEDVYAGTIIGTTISCLVYLLLQNMNKGGKLDSTLSESFRN